MIPYMDLLTPIDAGIKLSKVFAALVLILLLLGEWRRPVETNNFLYGQGLGRVVAMAGPLVGAFGLECDPNQRGLFGEASLNCRSTGRSPFAPPIRPTETTTTTTPLGGQ